jgi:hypothetical protein
MRSPSAAHAANQPSWSFGRIAAMVASTSPMSAPPRVALPSSNRTLKSQSPS